MFIVCCDIIISPKSFCVVLYTLHLAVWSIGLPSLVPRFDVIAFHFVHFKNFFLHFTHTPFYFVDFLVHIVREREDVKYGYRKHCFDYPAHTPWLR